MRLFYTKDRQNLNDETFNIVQSISKAKNLFKILISKVHPDKHPENVHLATELTSLVNNNKFNYRELLKLEERIKTELESK